MRPNRRNLAIAALVCALITALIFATSQRARGPVQDGRHLDEWLLLLSPVNANQRSLAEMNAAKEAPQAIRTLGTNALPYLIQAITIDGRPSRFRGAAGWLLTRMPFLQQIDPLRQWVYGFSNLELQRAGGAFRAFEILGVTARSALPALTNALQHADTRQSVEYAIQQITAPPKTNTPPH